MSLLAALGNLSRDVVSGAPPRPGGTVFYAGRALAHLRADACLGASCAEADRGLLVEPLSALGLPFRWYPSQGTAAYRIRYLREGRRVLRQEAIGDPWPPDRALEAAGEAAWVQVGALVRGDFPEPTLAALAAGRTLLLDGQGLVRARTLGPLRLAGSSGGELRHVRILKLDEEEAAALLGSADPARLPRLGVAEVLLTLGERGAVVATAGRTYAEPAVAVAGRVDPTGAGDMFSAVYLATRAEGGEPPEALRRAAAVVAELLAAAS
ncbi:MAG TPA: PfkB family carbohydrate kinase [Gaiellaceae bacterium]|nr:PfkB family carbohydrate kinase [Gaiellaceae bacterium]